MEMAIEPLDPPYLVIRPGISEEDFYRFAGEDNDWEYIDGRIVMHSPASFQHEDLQGFLLTLFRLHLGKRGGGKALGSRFPMRLDGRWSPEPDILVVTEGRCSAIGKQRLEGPADLVVEIVSEADSHLVYLEKLPRYRDAGIPEIWIVDPFRREILVDRAAACGRESLKFASGRLESTAVAGFRIDAGWLWREELSPPHECLDLKDFF
jgi:Uma2 family endonuclease